VFEREGLLFECPITREISKSTIAKRANERIGDLVQRRHDIVHNCDRPKSRPQRTGVSSARNAIADIEGFVAFVDEHIDARRILK